jgi:ankyrin repeat protein
VLEMTLLGWIALCFAVSCLHVLPTSADLTDLYEHAKMPEIVIETINDYDARGKTPLLYAATVGHLETLMNMLKAGAEVNKPAENSTDTGE